MDMKAWLEEFRQGYDAIKYAGTSPPDCPDKFDDDHDERSCAWCFGARAARR